MNAAGVLPDFTGSRVHDAWAPYDTYENISAHQLCGAHLLRELQAVTDHHAVTGQDSACRIGAWCWATQAADALGEVNRLVTAARTMDGTLDGLDEQAVALPDDDQEGAVGSAFLPETAVLRPPTPGCRPVIAVTGKDRLRPHDPLQEPVSSLPCLGVGNGHEVLLGDQLVTASAEHAQVRQVVGWAVDMVDLRAGLTAQDAASVPLLHRPSRRGRQAPRAFVVSPSQGVRDLHADRVGDVGRWSVWILRITGPRVPHST